MAGSTTSLAGGFAPRGTADWEALLDKDLKGADPARLRSRTEDGIEIQPLYTEGKLLEVPARAAEPVQRLAALGSSANGRIAEAISHELEYGADGILLELSTPGHSDGIAAEPTDWDAVFDSLESDGALHLRANAFSLAHARAWLESGAFGSRAGCTLGLDPFSVAALTGDFDALGERLEATARLGAEALTHPANPRPFVLDAAPYSRAGATTAQSTGCLLAGMVEVLRALESASVDPARAFDAIGLCLRLDPRFFEQIAALRAIRLLQFRIATACGIESPAPLYLMALPAERMLSRRDPWVNMLRQTATSFAALVGGADAVGATAFDRQLEKSSELGRRIARNTPTILAEESHLGRVQDPAAGSWFLDEFTREIAAAGWAFFQAIEAEGGLSKTFASGWLLEQIQAKKVERDQRLASRKLPRTGVTEFANVSEELPAAAGPMVAATGRSWPRHGFDDAFEELRSAADRHAIAHPRPTVFLARAGNPAAYSAREMWLRNLVAAAGIETVAGDPAGDAAKEFVASGAATAILTADDATLAERGPELASRLGQFGTVWAAGKPTGELSEAGVSHFVHIGIDVVNTLGDLLSEQGVQR